MGKKDNAIVPFLKVKTRFSDMFNAGLFHGRQLILPEELEIMDSVQILSLQDKKNKKLSEKRYRDIVMRWKLRFT